MFVECHLLPIKYCHFFYCQYHLTVLKISADEVTNRLDTTEGQDRNEKPDDDENFKLIIQEHKRR